MDQVRIVTGADGLTVATEGRSNGAGLRDCCVRVDEASLVSDCYPFLETVLAYMEAGRAIAPGETMGYGYWITKAVADGEHRLDFWERCPDKGIFIPGISNTLRYWREQHRVCTAACAPFAPPNPGQLVVISDGVYEGDAVQGIRYPSPSHMSGWWITTDRYDGNVSSLRTEHIHHVSSKRPDLAQFLGLDYGYRFYSDNGEVLFHPAALE